ncbi:uncharacterized protein M421DRAFT_52627 [Didymella exigua CBS 183.55]|uniref:Utp8 beta-propeller domain-containing protein n=1 Tax=Didymella exigua CBS 183.55 TaxID=1150837 RepID=A0A6A5S0S3_9PLEO|nr:uncharacterized protein M421DRAFT_52627 [Didymella exigua CBS 183.55]KAF1933190.1 hypothetical protein M421DRAFT_52627 [Didymella exigua CBS 183.55]
MSSDKEIGAPFTLASLSKPVSSTNGRIHATGVCSISGIKKRKRTEIVVGVEGECISIYSLQNPQLVTSYALPPSASFTAAPYSTYRKGSSKAPAHRFTYASTTESTAGAKSQVICFHETILGDNAETAKTSYTPSNGSQVSTIESVPVAGGSSSKDSAHDVLATFENGDVICLSADLSTVRWVANLRAAGSQKEETFKIENVTLSTARNVMRGLLRSREDIAALLSTDSSEASDLLELTQILCVIGQNANGTRTLQLLQVQPRNEDLPSTQLQPLKHLLSISLPKPSSILLRTDSTATYSLHATSGALHILVDGGVISYDLSGTVPNVTSELLLSEAKIDSFLRISQDIVFTTAPGSCRVFDVKYSSLQAYLSLGAAPISDDASKKRKHAQPESELSSITPQVVAYYAELGLVVAVRDDELLGMQYGGTNARKRVKTEGTLLIDALGKGIAKPKPSAESAKWSDRKEKLDRYASKSKIAKFEGVLASCLGIPLEKKTDAQSKQENEVQGGPLTNGVGPSIPKEDAMVVEKVEDEASEDQLRKWNIPTAIPESQRQSHRQHALYALSKIFKFEGSTLKVAFFPPNVFQWLLQIGHLTKESIRRAHLDEAPELAHNIPKVTDGDIVKAIVAFDPELHILSAVLNHKHFLPIGEVVEAIRLLTQSLDDKPSTADGTIKLLTNGTAPADTDMDLDVELDAATTEVDHALTVLSNGVTLRSNTLRPALIRLHTFPAPVISSTLRSVLPRRDLESLIRLLHFELKNGGWSSQYDFIPSPSEELPDDSPDDHAVTIIAALLSSTLDAIGAGAWLAGVSNPADATDDGKDIIDALHADTSEALNGFWEARYMRGLLGEFLRYAANLPKSAKPSSKSLENQGKPFAVSGIKEDDLPMLPLGGRGDMGVEKTKQGKGGRKEERSKREIGMLISKKVPKYSFERIIV